MQRARRPPSSPGPSTHLTVLMPGSLRDGQTVAGSASVRPCRRRLLDRLLGTPGRRGRPDRVPGCACPADRWTGDRTWESGGQRLGPDHSGRRVVPARWARGAGRRRCSPSSSGAPEFCAALVRADRGRDGVAGRWWLLRHGIRGSLSWRAGDSSEHVRALVEGASSPAGSADWNPAPARD